MKTKNIKYLFIAVCVLFSTAAMAQGTRISGTVSDLEGPIMMCNVVEIDANNRIVSNAQTDINGNFSMEIVNTKNKLQVSYVGYKKKTLPIGDKTTFNIMLEDETTIAEVVIKAKPKYRQGGLVIPENEVSAAKQTFNMSEVEGLSFTSADEALQGQIAGLDIVANSGNLGAGTSMRLRGVSSITTTSEPLIVVDGNIFDDERAENFDWTSATDETYAALLSVNPSDIDAITVLKDAAATAIWGSRGANGVISITTKRGSRGATKVDYSLRVQASWQPKGYNLLNGDEYTMMLKEMYFNPEQKPSVTDKINEINYNRSWAEFENWNNNTDWVKEVTQVGWNQQHYLTISGGGEKANFRISAGYDHSTGSIIRQKLDRFTTKLALDYFVSDRIVFRTTFPLAYTYNNKNYKDLLGIAQKLAPNMSIYRQNADGTDTDEFYIMLPSGVRNDGSSVAGTSSLELNAIRNLGNPVAIANLAWKREKVYRMSPEFKIDYYLLGKDEEKTRLDYTGLIYMNINFNSNQEHYPGQLLTDKSVWGNNDYNRVQNYDSNSLSFTTRHWLTFTPRFRNKDWYTTFLGQWEMNMGNSNNQTTAVSNVPTGIEVPSVDGKRLAPSSGNGEWRSMSMTFQSHMSYKSRYVLGFSYRADGRTGLEDARKWSYSPSVSARWNAGDEPFLKWARPGMSALAFRFGWGIVGNLPRTDLQFASYITSGNYGIYDMDAISYLEALQLNRLQVERTMEYNIGGNFGFFNDLITGDFNYYFRRTRDMLMGGIRIPSTTGFSQLGQANVGEMTNKGWELNVNANRFLKIGKFEMSANFNIAQNLNEIVEMEESVLEANNPEWNASERGTYLKRIQVGNPLGSIYGLRFKGVYQYSYDYLINLKNSYGWNGDQFRDYINNEFLATGKTAPIAIDGDGHVLMDSHGNPIRLVYNYRDGSPTYKFRGGDAIYEDINNDGQINSLDIVYLGNSNPKINGGFGFSFFYDNWTLKTHFTYRFGHKVINTARMNLEEMYNAYNQSSAVNWRWRKNGDVTTIPRALFNSGYNWQGSDRYVEDASFVRFTYVQLSYRFKKKFVQSLGLRNLQLSLAGQNILTFSKYSGIDPERSPGAWGLAYDNSQTPRSKQITMNINVGF